MTVICKDCAHHQVTEGLLGAIIHRCHVPDVDPSRTSYVTGEALKTTVVCSKRNLEGTCSHYEKLQILPDVRIIE